MAENEEKTVPSPEQKPSAQNAIPKPDVTEIPEEYLTDEYLYPTDSGSTASKKKTSVMALFVVGAIVLIIATLFVFNTLIKAKPGSIGNPGKTTLTYWGLWDDKAVMTQIINEYQKENPNIKIDYVMRDPKDSYRERLVATAQKGTGPDIFRYHNTWVSGMTDILAPAPTTVFDVDSFKKQYYPVIASDLVQNNQIVGVPLGIDGLVLVYNQKLFNNAGVSTLPLDWESLTDISRQLTIKNQEGTIRFSGVAMGTAENVTHFSDILGLMFLQNGVQLADISSDNATAVLDVYTSFSIAPTEVWNETLENSVAAFADEKTAMAFVPYWELEVIKHMNPDIDFKVLPVPQIKGTEQKAIANYWVEGVSRSSKYQAEAWKFLAYLSSKESLLKMQELDLKSGRQFPSRPYPRVDMASLIVQDPYMGAVIKEAPYMESIPLIDRTYDNGINDKNIAYLKDAVNSVLFGSASNDALSTAQSGISQILEQYSYKQTK